MVSVGLFASTQRYAFGEGPSTSPGIAPPAGNVLFLTGHAIGTQNYVCLPSATGGRNDWVLFAPQATLSVIGSGHVTRQAITHFLSPVDSFNGAAPPACRLSRERHEVDCPTWQSAQDSSAIWGGRVSGIVAGSNASCPNAGAIPCLLLKSIGTRRGQRGIGVLTKTTYVQRLNTMGGAAPSGSCTVGDQALVPYQADYSFFSAEHDGSNKGEKQ